MDLVKRAKEFINRKWDGRSPVLLGYSGGPDSKALLYALLELNLPLHLAHVDHGWREESAAEAQLLADEAAALGLPFHSTRLKTFPKKNAEAHARASRLSFFKSLFLMHSFQALLLAHHADDWAETVLKRLLEGAHLPFLGGFSSSVEGMEIWRPLLQIPKRAVWEFLNQMKLEPLLDRTNEDSRYLRNRIRSEIIPRLSQQFQKEVSGNLCLLAERSQELKEYFDRKVDPAWRARREGEGTIELNFEGLERIEARHLLQRAVKLSREELELVLNAILGRSKSFQYKKIAVNGAVCRILTNVTQ